MKPLLLTMGDPTGIGPELIIKALLDGAFAVAKHQLQVIGDVQVLLAAGELFGVDGKVISSEGNISLLAFDRQVGNGRAL